MIKSSSHKSNQIQPNLHCGQWDTESYLSEHVRMKFLQYGTGFTGECSEVTESTVTCLLKVLIYTLIMPFGWNWTKSTFSIRTCLNLLEINSIGTIVLTTAISNRLNKFPCKMLTLFNSNKMALSVTVNNCVFLFYLQLWICLLQYILWSVPASMQEYHRVMLY